MTKDYILNEIKRVAFTNGGKALGKEKFEKETGIKFSDWYGKFWVKWSDAVSEAGFEANSFNQAYTEEFVIGKMIELIRELGHYPVSGEVRMKSNTDPDFPSHNVFTRIGNKAVFVQKILSFCERNSGFDDIQKICSPLINIASSTPLIKSKKDENYNSVYLFKSGKYYKIGRSNSSGRREYEVGLKLPENITKIHEIKTDDPIGIEAYWHNRFREKRKNGEWFELSAEEINIFKKRKFM